MGGGPGNSYRRGISLMELHRMFPDDATAEAWFIRQRWPGGIFCPHCGSANVLEQAEGRPRSAGSVGGVSGAQGYGSE